jgi:uncharacterized protein (TIGR03437 family)
VQPRITHDIDEAQLVTLTGNTHPLARAEYDQGAAPPDLPMERMLLLLRRSPEQEASLQQLLEEQQDPGSVHYRQWLTPEQFGEQFGPALEDTEKITAWLTSQGFRVGGVANGRNVVEFSGTAAQVERALHTEIHSYLVNGEQHWANARDPQIPAALSPVVAGIVSLHNFAMKALHHSAGSFRKAPGGGTWSPAGLSPEYSLFPAGSGLIEGLVGPYDFATIYNVLPLWNAGIDGTGQSIAVAGRSNINVQDVRNFRSVFGLPAKDPTVVVNGTDPGTAVVDDEMENVGDVEWAGAIAKAATIYLVVSKSTSASDGADLSAVYAINNKLAGTKPAPVLSFSYGNCELLMTTAHNQFYNGNWEQAAAEGITVVVASGDNGSAACDVNDSAALFGLAVSGAASTPYNVAVGGTDFSDLSSMNQAQYWNSGNAPGTLESAKSYIPEMTWNDSCASPELIAFFGASPGSSSGEAFCNNSSLMKQLALVDVTAGGGGASGLYAKPSWQSGVFGIPADGSRDVPDVSLFAGDGIWLHSYPLCQADNGGPCSESNGVNGLVVMTVGGTSVGTPAFAGIIALVNQKIGSPQGLANPVLYQLASSEYGGSNSPNMTNLRACNASTPPASGNSCLFYDVTAGNNDVPCLNGLLNCYVGNPSDTYGLVSTSSSSLVPAYAAGTGYDLATGLGSLNVANLVDNWPPPPPPALSVAKAHLGNFTEGQTNATYTVTVSNGASAGPTSGTVTVTENPPTGLTVVSMTGSEWSCTGSTCTRSDVLYGGSSYPAITVTVNVAPNAPSQVTNQVTVSGGNSKSGTATDLTNIVLPSALSVGKSHPGNFAQGQTNAAYTVTVSNGASAAPTNGVVTISETVPTGLTLVSMAGTGWTCPASSCTRSDALPAGASYPPIAVIVNVAPNAPAQVTNQVTVSGGGSVSATASDVTIVVPRIPTATAATASPNSILTTASTILTAVVTPASGGGTPTGTVTFTLGSTVLGSATLTVSGGTAQATLLVQGSQLAVGANSITANYGGDANYSPSAASVSVTVTLPGPISKTHNGNFTQGQMGATYVVTVALSASVPGTFGGGGITVTEYIPTGLTLVSMAGSGWSCANPTCKRSDLLGSSSSYPPITVTVNVASNAPSQVTNQVTVSGGNSSSPVTASDVTQIVSLQPTATAVVAKPNPISTSGSTTLTATVTAAGGSGTPTGAVTFTLGSTVLGSGTLSGSGGTAQATSPPVSGGSPLTIGDNIITASYGGDANHLGSSGSVTVTVTSGPYITNVENGASFQAGFGSATWVSIVGTNLSQTTRLWQGSDFVGSSLPTSLSGVSVTIDGLPAYVEYISPTQINVLAPDDAAVGAVQVQVTDSQVTSNSFTAQKQQFSPAFFTFAGSYVAAQHADYSLVGKPGLIAGVTSTPAAPGETVLIWATGFGPTNPPLPTGQLVAAPAAPANSVTFTIGGVTAPVAYSGLVGSGLYQFNVTVPNVPNGDAAVVAQVGGVQTQTGALIAVQSPLSTPPAPQITSLTPASGPRGGPVSLVIGGSNLSSVTAVQFSPSTGITVSNVNATASQVTATVNIAAGAPTGQVSVSVSVWTSAGISNALVFTILAPGPQITSLSPASGSPGSTVSLSIAGSNLSGVTGVQFSPSTGITVSNVNATASQVTATVNIAAGAPTGQVGVSVSSPAGTSNALVFTILAPVPQITSLSPASGSPGSTVSLSIAGSNLSGVTAVQFSPSTGITASNVNATASQVTATVTIAASAPAGQVSVSVSSPAGVSNALVFTILAPVPQITSLSPTSGSPGSTVSLSIAGSNLSGVTGVQFSPSTGITESNVNATASQVTAMVNIAASAAAGSRNVSVSSPAGTSNALVFTILAPVPQITSLSPASGSPGSTVSLSIAGSNLSGVTAVQFSPSTGITVSNVNANASQVTATVNIAASAPSGQVSVSVSSSAGASNLLYFTILSPSCNYAGQWNGTTSQSQPVSMTVVSCNVTAYSYGVNFPNLGSNCPTGVTVTSGSATSIPIAGSTFTSGTISGTFQSPTQVIGTINWTVSLPGCNNASGFVTWSAVKQ